MRPPNYMLLVIWLPVILLAFIVGYLKRENLYILYEPKYWAIAAMVCFPFLPDAYGVFKAVVFNMSVPTQPCKQAHVYICAFFVFVGMDLCDDIRTNVE